MNAPTRCSAAPCRSTDTSAAPGHACCCQTTRTSNASTRCARPATRSWSGRRPSGWTTPGCSCDRRPCASNFFTAGDVEKLVYCPSPRVPEARARLEPTATVVDGGRHVDMRTLSSDLAARGVQRLMVEGGGTVHTQFLTGDLADELQLVVAPLFVGDSESTRFVRDGRFPWNAGQRARLSEVRQVGDVVLLRYALSPRFRMD